MSTSNKLRAILMRGLPGSGKSTAAKALVDQNPGLWYRINRDTIREMLLESHTKHLEKMAVRMRDAMFVAALQDGRNVVVDDCNLDIDKKLAHFQSLVDKAGLTDLVEFEVIDLCHIPVNECIARDLARGMKPIQGRSVGAKVIRRMWNQMLAPKIPKPERDPNKKDAVIFDIDGTLALMNGRDPYDTSKYWTDLPNEPIIEVLRLYRHHTNKAILIVSGRDNLKRKDTEEWLRRNDIQFEHLFMRPDNDVRNDALIKKEIMENDILPNYNITMVYDDRNRVVDMWRAHGYTVAQVAEGDF